MGWGWEMENEVWNVYTDTDDLVEEEDVCRS